jgi:hypothetical protein
MALLLLEGFEDGLHDDGRWADQNINGPSTSYGVDGTKGANFNANTSRLRFAPNTTALESASMFIGARVRPGGAGESPLFRFYADTAATVHNWVSINANMGLSAFKGDGTLLGQTANNLLVSGVWAYVEANSVLGDTTGDIAIKVNGASQLTLTNIDTKNGGTDTKYDSIAVARTSGSGASYDVDDIYICSSLTTRHNTFLGDIRVGLLLPNGTGSNSGFTPSSTGLNYTKVDETTPSSTDYVGTTSTGTKDSYNFQNVSTGTVSQIIGVIGSPWVAKSDVGQTRFMRMFSLGGGSTTYGASNAVSTSYRTYETPFPVGPTGSTWTVTSLNAAQFGIQLRNT